MRLQTVREAFAAAGHPVDDDAEIQYTAEIDGYNDIHGHSGDQYWFSVVGGKTAFFINGAWATEYVWEDGVTMYEPTPEGGMDLSRLPAEDAWLPEGVGNGS